MKSGVLFISLFLVSLLVISGCGPQMSYNKGKGIAVVELCNDMGNLKECESSSECSWCKTELSNKGGAWTDFNGNDAIDGNELFFDYTTGEGWWWDISGCNLNCEQGDNTCDNSDIVSYPGYCTSKSEVCLLPGDVGGGEGFFADGTNLPFTPDNYLDNKDLASFIHHFMVGLNDGSYNSEELAKTWPQADIACTSSHSDGEWECLFGQIDVQDLIQMMCIFGLP